MIVSSVFKTLFDTKFEQIMPHKKQNTKLTVNIQNASSNELKPPICQTDTVEISVAGREYIKSQIAINANSETQKSNTKSDN